MHQQKKKPKTKLKISIIVHGIGTILVSKKGLYVLYTVGKHLYWGIRISMLTKF